jgi:hypothetical protein
VTDGELPDDLGIDPGVSAAVDTLAERTAVVLPTGEAGEGAAIWAYTTETLDDAWTSPDFDDSGWERGRAGFGTEGTPGIRVRTTWNAPEIWLRTSLELPELAADDQLTLRYFHDEDVRMFVNGQPLLSARGFVTSYQELVLDARQRGLFRAGANVIAVHCRQTGGGQGVDVGLTQLRQD